MSNIRITILGAGLVGNVIAADLAGDFSVTVADIDQTALDKLGHIKGIKTIRADLSLLSSLCSAVKDADIVVGSLPGSMGYLTIKALIPLKKDIVDISFFPEDPFSLDAPAAENNITVITDCGVAPGMGNIILGYHSSTMKVDSFSCYVGGLPVVREWPWEYRAVFSPSDVIEEYTRKARYLENGRLVVREAMSDPELIYFDGIGSLEAWNSDGLRTLLKTMKVPNMIEKTMRYPGTTEYLRVLRQAGFFSSHHVEIGGNLIRPVDLTARLLFPAWELKPGEEDFTAMRIIITGSEHATGKNAGSSGNIPSVNKKKFVWDLLDRYDRPSATTSMARTTGYTCTAAVHLLANGMAGRKGLCPPEYLGENSENFNFIMRHLNDRGVQYRLTESRL
jgi:lysine 6-dehydrogenase